MYRSYMFLSSNKGHWKMFKALGALTPKIIANQSSFAILKKLNGGLAKWGSG